MTYGKLKLDMRSVKPGERIYLGISGGLDSAYLAWRLLKRGHPMLFHHCTYKTGQKRYPKEEVAYRAVLDWLTEQGLTDWSLITTEFASSGSMTFKLLDDEYLFWIAGLHLKLHRKGKRDRADIKHVVVPSRVESHNRHDRTYRRMYQIMSLAAERDIQPIWPMEKYNKTQMLADMPRELIDLCWYCRKPNGDEPCGTCHSCRRTLIGLEALEG